MHASMSLHISRFVISCSLRKWRGTPGEAGRGWILIIEIDGSHGEGGGQILRSSLALSIVTGKPFRIEKIRAGRKKPGLMRQHLTAVTAAGRICNAKIDGAGIGA